MAENINILDGDSEDIFLSDILDKYKFWKARAAALKADRRDASLEDEFATAYKLLLSQFSYMPPEKPAKPDTAEE